MIALFSSKAEMSAAVSEMVALALAAQPSPRILFPTGSTPLGDAGFFAALARLRAGGLPTERIRLVGGDEYGGVESVSDSMIVLLCTQTGLFLA
jgi:6-phosphogluconolactonase/glucosamine-6-phosphate isomerase/deaminase